MGFFEKQKGAISIFLVIVLLPMMMLSAIFVDSSRIRLAKSVASSAGDLTLNTALTQYDSVLKDMYGLFATSQNIDDLLENLEDYYRKNIVASGVAAADADDYVGQIMSLFKSASSESNDLLNISIKDFSATKPTGGSLANPAILKAQIVEFMKYRAPLNVGLGFIEGLKSMKNLSKQTDLVDKKNDFYNEKKTILEKLEAAWKEIQTYQYANATSDNFPTGAYIQDKATALNSYAPDVWKDIINDTVRYLYDYNNFKNNQISISYDEENNKWSFQWFGETVNCNPPYNSSSTVTTDSVQERLTTVLESIKIAKKYKDESPSNKIFNLISGTPNTADAERKIYTVNQFNKAGKSDYTKAVKDLLVNLIALESAMEFCDDDEMRAVKIKFNADDLTVELAGDEEAGSNISTLYIISHAQINAHLKLGGNTYIDLLKNYSDRLNTYHGELTDTVNGKATSVNTKIKTIRDTSYDFYQLINKRQANLTRAVTLLGQVKTALNGSYNTALNNWQSSANTLSGDSMGKADLHEIEEVKKLITVAQVDALITRLNNAKASLESVKTEIDKYKFGSTSWRSIAANPNYNTIKNMFSASHKSTIESIEVVNRDSYNDVIGNIRDTVVKGNIATSWSQSNNPNIAGNDQTQLYTWLYNNYYDPNMSYADDAPATENKTKSADDKFDSSKEEIKKEADANAENAKKENASTSFTGDLSDYISISNLPSLEWADLAGSIEAGKVETDADKLTKNASGAVKSLLDQVMGLLNSMGVSFRDKIYICDYIMNMFSYDTYEAELVLKNGNSPQLPVFTSIYEKDGSKYKVKSGFEKYADSALSLTKNPISPNGNYLYGSEVEYIIYGGNNAALNKTGAYGTIFLIRFALNTVYAFTDAEINNVTLAAATAIFGTPPLTPLIPIAKIAMTIGLSIAESAYDLYELKQGKEIPLYKNTNTWLMKPSSAGKALAGEALKIVVNEAVKVGYDVLDGALKKTDEEFQKIIDGGTEEIKNLADAAVESTLDKFYNYANEALQEVVSICNNLNNEAMLNNIYNIEDPAARALKAMEFNSDKLNKATVALDEWLAKQGSSTDDVVFAAKKVAVDYLKSNGGEKITEVFNAIKDTATNASNSANILESKLDSIKRGISDKVYGLADGANEKLTKMKDETMAKIEEAAKGGAEKLRSALTDQIDSVFGASSASGTGTTNVVSSLLSWSYSNYLTLFLLVGLATPGGEEAILLRTADVIELNMQKANNLFAVSKESVEKTQSRFFGLYKKKVTVENIVANSEAYKLNKSFTYLKIDATLEVKPLLMALPFMAETTKSELDGSAWYTIKYSGTLGY